MQQGRSRRPVRVVMLTLLVASLMVLTVESNHNNAADDEDVLPVLLLDSRRISATDSNAADRYDEREARMALVQPTQSPRAKARREQALRSILAQRRRKAQVASRRSGSVSSSSGSHHGGYPAPTTRRRVSLREQQPLVVPMTGAGVHDLLEMQESQNGLYVTVPEHSAAASNNDTHEIVIQTLAGSGSGSSSTSTTTTTTTTTTVTRRTKPVRSTTTSTTTTTTPSSNAVVGSLEYRGKKTVAMPASLYNHFRPVESNIPIEDMSQFLYFGQKLRGATGKDGSMPSPSPKKLLAGLSDILDDDMNSVDRRPGGAMSSKSTKMRTTSLREHTTKPTCPDKETTNTRANSINSTVPDKAVADTASSSNLSLRIAVTESPAVTSEAPVITTPSTTTTSTTTPATTTSTAPSTTTSTTTPSTTTTTTQETPRYTVPSRSKQQHEQHQRQRAALRNSSESTGSSSSSSSSAEQRGAITSSSSSSSAAATTASLSAGATVEQAAAASSSSPAAASNHSATAVHKQPQSQQQPQQSPGFTIRWTDARAASKRRRLAAAASSSSSTSNNNRRRDKSSRTTMDELPSSTTPATTTSTTTSLPSSSSTTTTTTETSNDVQQQTTTMEPEQFDTTTTPNPMVDNEVIGATTTVKMLDPSEVQKMYRSSTPKPAPEVINEVSSSSSTTASEDLVSPPSSPSSTTSATTVRVSPPERSPEVRARNLADKAKDDVLPIMQRFNTSSLFNESASTTTTSSTTSTSTTTTNTPRTPVSALPPSVPTVTTAEPVTEATSTTTTPLPSTTTTTRPAVQSSSTPGTPTASVITRTRPNRTRTQQPPQQHNSPGYYPLELGGINRTGGFFEPVGYVTVQQNASEVTSRRHDADALASQETIAIVSYILASLLVFPIAVGVGLILRRLILRNRKVLEESDTSSEISCRKDALNLETGDFKMPIEKTITKLPRIQHLCHEVEKPPPPSSQESRWEFPRDKLRLQTVLGEGNFGQVWKAEADDLTGHQGTTRLVAVKTVKEGASDREKEDLVRELEIMQRVGSHPNVVTLLGCCTEQEPHYLILEYVMYGKLLAYLRDHRTRQDFYNFSEDSAALTSRDLTVFGYCVARGMEYLASKKIIHRDLAARNVLVDHNKLCKIADFGMSRFANEDGEVIETRHGRNALPIRWMAPESLIYSLFTTKTDVWSFGILMWEIVTLGSTPYPDMTAREVMRSVQSGYRLERPSHCRSELFRVIARCWHADPDRRPEFAHLRRDLAQLLEDNMNGHYVDLESFASECTD